MSKFNDRLRSICESLDPEITSADLDDEKRMEDAQDEAEAAREERINERYRTIPVKKDYVEHDGVKFCVSTVERASSAAGYPGRYNETIVWSLKPDGSLDSILEQDEAGKGSLSTHDYWVKKITKDGIKKAEEE